MGNRRSVRHEPFSVNTGIENERRFRNKPALQYQSGLWKGSGSFRFQANVLELSREALLAMASLPRHFEVGGKDFRNKKPDLKNDLCPTPHLPLSNLLFTR